MTARSTRSPSFLVLALGLALSASACGATDVSPVPPSAPEATTLPVATTPAATSAAASPAGSAAAATLDCAAPATPTTPQTEGPYYVPGAPQRADLVDAGMPGTVLALTGYVVDTSCTPLANAKVEIWQADANGEYDNSGGYRLRGYVLTDADGRYAFRTVVPGEYPGRTEHIHVKITPDGGTTLTTQLYFPGATANEGDNIYSPDLLLDITETADGLAGTFTFIVQA